MSARKWAEMERTIQKLLAQTQARDTSRPPLRGSAIPGNAWAEYTPALTAARKLVRDNWALREYASSTPSADGQKVVPIVAAYRKEIDRLSRGARATDGLYPRHWKEGFSAPIPDAWECTYLTNLTACQARLLMVAGESRHAAELLLDTCQFARDLGFNGDPMAESLSLQIYGMALDQLRELVGSSPLSHNDLAEIERELGLLDDSFPKTEHSLLNEALAIGSTFLKMDQEGQNSQFGNVPLKQWKYGFSPRLILADAFNIHAGYLSRFSKVDSMPWTDVAGIGANINLDNTQQTNPISRILTPQFVYRIRAGRERRAQLRLLAVVVHYRRRGDILELGDPFGNTLRTSRTGDRFKVWSVGSDGADDGGIGGWDPSKGKDIVLEVKR